MKKALRLFVTIVMTPVDWLLCNILFGHIYGFISMKKSWEDNCKRTKELLP